MRLLICIGTALVLHLLLGWEWSLLAGIFCGMMMASRAWLWGAITTGASWSVLVIYNLLASPESVLEMIRAMGQVLGNLPGALIVVLTVLIGSLLGLAGALIGNQLTNWIPALKLYKEPPGMIRT